MGCSSQVICNTCKTVYWCGYGSYSNHDGRTALFDKMQHEGHDYFTDCGDGTYEDGDDLHEMGSYGSDGGIVSKGYKKFKRVSLVESE